MKSIEFPFELLYKIPVMTVELWTDKYCKYMRTPIILDT